MSAKAYETVHEETMPTPLIKK